MRARNAVAVVPLIAVGILLAGCARTPERAATVGTQSAAPAPQETSAAPKPKGAGDALTAAQAKSVESTDVVYGLAPLLSVAS